MSQILGPDARAEAPGAPLGPDSLLWRIASDWRSGLSGLSAGILQLAWPHLGLGVEEHSAFFEEPWDRIHRSVPQIWATIFADDADDRGLQIRDYHRDIKGTDRHGQRYHALDPETFWWAHATFTWEMFQTSDEWDHRSLSPRHREQLYQETVTWYRRYGVSDRPVPADVAAFEARWDVICRTRLELTPTAERAIDMALHDRVAPPGMPPAVAAVATPAMRLLALGGLPKVVRER
ncbi:MAG TPA: oxygenase MpaB family protein, partial [Acidimicrobiia bacterium]|nr:oxygenase MpaB family protein [Acidimicrobiia bacterium]